MGIDSGGGLFDLSIRPVGVGKSKRETWQVALLGGVLNSSKEA